MYVLGGSSGREIFKAVIAYNLAESKAKWVVKASMIERRCYLSSVVLDGQIYAFGGFNQQQRTRKCER